jgi:1,4-dihydroxy-2-naphthoate octaprenyltransferase
MAARPKTLPAAIAPVVIGTAMAYGDGRHHFLSAAFCLFCALLIQIGTNLSNDYFDFKKGADNCERIGPTRITQAGLVKPSSVKTAFILVFLTAVLASLYLVFRGGWPIVIIGIVSIASGILYTAGPKPLGYIGLGELFVLIFFGPVPVAGTYYVQSLEWNTTAVLAGFASGFLSVSMLAVNNYRDMHTDKETGKCTLAVLFGRTFARYEYIVSILAASLMPVIIYSRIRSHPKILLCALLALIAIPSIKKVLIKADGPVLNSVLADTGKLMLIYSIVFSLGWIV